MMEPRRDPTERTEARARRNWWLAQPLQTASRLHACVPPRGVLVAEKSRTAQSEPSARPDPPLRKKPPTPSSKTRAAPKHGHDPQRTTSPHRGLQPRPGNQEAEQHA